jgi:dihydropteroate synthase
LGERIYIRPLGIIHGRVAREAIEAGAALPLAGGMAAFDAAELIEGRPSDNRRVFARAATLRALDEPAIGAALDMISAPRPPVAGLSLDRPRLMGVVNVTPDSFSDGGDFASPDKAIAHARALAAEGADILDIGGESTRPGSEAVSLQDERTRVMPVIEGLKDMSTPISLDTRKAALMAEGARAGVKLLNDVSALGFDAESLGVAAQAGLPVVLMHAQGDPKTMQDNPHYDDVLLEVFDFLALRIAAAIEAGIPRSRLIADPGIGFGKTLEHNLALLNGLSIFHGLGVPLLVGASRKRFIGTLTGETEAKARLPGSIAAALVAVEQGVQILRVHDVRETRQALAVWRAASVAAVPEPA